VALVTVMIFIILLSTLAVAMMTLMTNYPMLIERQIKSVKAQYVAEGAIWRNYMNYLAGTQTPPNVENIQETIDGITYKADVAYQAGAGPGDPGKIIANVAY
jgi:type II secretory pathway component PulK